MFPLGSVLLPYMPLSLRLFEERYIVMLSRVLQEEPSEFGVVLIERGQEVGGGLEGGEQRFGIGTVARIIQLEAAEGYVGLVAQGGRRISVTQWLPDDPHPVAEFEYLPDLEWNEELRDLLEQADQVVRRTLSKASEFVDAIWSAETELSDDPMEHAWQLAGIAPIGALDQLAMLHSTDTRQLLDAVIESTLAAEESLVMAWDAGLDADDANED